MAETVYKTGTQSADNPFKFVMSTDAVDRGGDIIEQKGWRLAEFRKNPIALWQHNANFPIGTWDNVGIEDGKLVGTLKMAAQGTSRLVDEVRSLLEQRILRAVSVGFTSDKSEPLDKNDDGYFAPQRFLKQTLLECSIVSVPANQEALMTRCKALGISRETQEILREGVSAPNRANTKGVSAPKPKPTGKKGNIMLGERIKAAETALDELRGSLNTLVTDTEGRSFTDDEAIQVETLSAEIDDNEKSLETLKKAEAGLAARKSAPRSASSEARPVHQQRSAPARAANPNDKPGCLLVKAAVVKTIAHAQKRSEVDVLEQRYGSDERKDAISLIMNTKADANTATTTGANGWAAELVTNDTRGWVADLEAVSITGALASAGSSIDFGGSNSVTVPSRDRSAPVAGSWVGENATIPVKDGKFTSLVLNRFKKAVVTVYSEELMQTSNPNIESVLRDAIRIDTAESIDMDLLDGSAGVATVRPGSILNGQPTAVSAGNTLDNIHTDLRFLMDSLSSVNAGRNAKLIMNPARSSGLALLTNATGSYVFRDQISSNMLMGYELIISTNCPAATVILCDAADFAIASGTPEFRVSDQATLVMLNDDGTDPTMADTNAVSVAGSVKVSDAATVVGGPAKVKSMFQQYSTALRSIYPLSWAMMRSGTSPYLTAVDW